VGPEAAASDPVDALLSRISGVRPVVLIDGRSGAGKSGLASAVARGLRSELVRLDDVYPGWDGLEAASASVRNDILLAHHWRRWDWAGGVAAEWHELDPIRALVIEGCGSLSLANRQLATFGVWIELDEPTRKARALARDGASYDGHWDAWAAQEQRFFDRERPDLLADVVVDGSTL
jgi:uridine kinase